jgi:hypothetical protein
MDLSKLRRDLNSLMLEGILDDRGDQVQCVWGWVNCSEKPGKCEHAEIGCPHARPHSITNCSEIGPCHRFKTNKAPVCSIAHCGGEDMPYYE